MLPRAHCSLVFLAFVASIVTLPVLAQVEPSATGNPGGGLDESQMMTPPPASGMPYASTSGSDARSNYMEAAVTVSPAYIDNVLLGEGSTPVSDFTYSIVPSVSLRRSTARQQEQIEYSPNFTFYQRVTALDSMDQSATATYQYRFNPQVAFTLSDNFAKTSNVFNSPYVFSNAVTGSALTSTPTVIAPYADQLINITNGEVSYQFARNAMIGGGGSFVVFDLPNP